MQFKKIFLILILLPCLCYSNEESLINAKDQYVQLIYSLSHGLPVQNIEILSENCIKKFNGEIDAVNRETFITQLKSVYNAMGSWSFDIVEVIYSANTIVFQVRIDLQGQHFISTVILRLNADYQITEINEVLTELDTCES